MSFNRYIPLTCIDLSGLNCISSKDFLTITNKIECTVTLLLSSIFWVFIDKIEKKGYVDIDWDSCCRIKCLKLGEQFWQPSYQYQITLKPLKFHNFSLFFFSLSTSVVENEFHASSWAEKLSACFLSALSCQSRDVQSKTQTLFNALEVRTHQGLWSLAAMIPLAEKDSGMEGKGCCCHLTFNVLSPFFFVCPVSDKVWLSLPCWNWKLLLRFASGVLE